MGKGPQESSALDFYFWATNEVKNAYSLYANQYILDHFLRDTRITHSGEDHLVIYSPCKLNDRVCHINKASNDLEPNFFFVYDVFFSTLGLRLPFIDFEIDYLNFLNIVLSQLHPNSWTLFQVKDYP